MAASQPVTHAQSDTARKKSRKPSSEPSKLSYASPTSQAADPAAGSTRTQGNKRALEMDAIDDDPQGQAAANKRRRLDPISTSSKPRPPVPQTTVHFQAKALQAGSLKTDHIATTLDVLQEVHAEADRLEAEMEKCLADTKALQALHKHQDKTCRRIERGIARLQHQSLQRERKSRWNDRLSPLAGSPSLKWATRRSLRATGFLPMPKLASTPGVLTKKPKHPRFKQAFARARQATAPTALPAVAAPIKPIKPPAAVASGARPDSAPPGPIQSGQSMSQDHAIYEPAEPLAQKVHEWQYSIDQALAEDYEAMQMAQIAAEDRAGELDMPYDIEEYVDMDATAAASRDGQLARVSMLEELYGSATSTLAGSEMRDEENIAEGN